MTAAEIVPANPAAALEALDPAQREVAVTQYLTDARNRLAEALEATGPHAVAALKAEIATAAEATKQLGLSKEIQTDAQEMVRRAEFALAKAIRAAQEQGAIVRQGEHVTGYANQHGRAVDQDKGISSVRDFIPEGNETRAQVFALADDVTEAEFEAALSDARDEGNLSRANVVRKVRGVKTDGLTPVEKLRKIREYAPGGMTSQQIGAEIGLTEQTVREVARKNGIEITADKVLAGTHRVRVDSNHIVAHAVMTLEALVTGFERINPADLDEAQTQNWTDSLTQSITALTRLKNKIKETIQ